MTLKRFVIMSKATGQWLASVYAERYDAVYGHFYIGQVCVASTETFHLVGDSGGRTGRDQTLAMFAGLDDGYARLVRDSQSLTPAQQAEKLKARYRTQPAAKEPAL